MQIGELNYAIRKALEKLDEWNDVVGLIPRNNPYYYELCAVIEDAVKIGSKVAVFGMDADLKNLDKPI
jgi:hypothetical protein